MKITHSNRWHTVGWAGAFLLGSQAPFGFPGPHMGCGRALAGAGSYSISVQPTPSPSASNHFCTQFCPLELFFLSVKFYEITITYFVFVVNLQPSTVVLKVLLLLIETFSHCTKFVEGPPPQI